MTVPPYIKNDTNAFIVDFSDFEFTLRINLKKYDQRKNFSDRCLRSNWS